MVCYSETRTFSLALDRSQLGEGFRSAPVGNIAVQQLVDQPGSFVVVLYDEVETGMICQYVRYMSGMSVPLYGDGVF